jgi:uncharacterized RDD family membrane protein YckC
MLRLLPFHMSQKFAKRFYENLVMFLIIALISFLVVYNSAHGVINF